MKIQKKICKFMWKPAFYETLSQYFSHYNSSILSTAKMSSYGQNLSLTVCKLVFQKNELIWHILIR